MLVFTDPNGHDNTWGKDPDDPDAVDISGDMWYSGCLQIGMADADSTGDQRLEYGIARETVYDTLISHVWADYLNSGYAAPTENFGVFVEPYTDESGVVDPEKSTITYEFRTPISAFSTDNEVTVGDEFGVCYNISWGNDMDLAHTQLGSGISGYAGKVER